MAAANSAGNRQLSQNQIDQTSRRGVQRQIHQVVSQRMIAPELVLDPKGAVQQRIVLLRRPHVEPDSSQTRWRAQVRPGNVRIIVPDEAALQGREESRANGDNHQRHPAPPSQCLRMPRGSLHGVFTSVALPRLGHKQRFLGPRRFVT